MIEENIENQNPKSLEGKSRIYILDIYNKSLLHMYYESITNVSNQSENLLVFPVFPAKNFKKPRTFENKSAIGFPRIIS